MRTRFTERFGVEIPIVQGGLAYLAHGELCAAVSKAGGLGQLTAATMGSPDALREEIRKVRALTDRPFAVNFAIGRRDLTDFIQVTIEERVEIISVTGGNPEPVFAAFHGHPVLKMVLVAGVRQARKAEALGADAVIAVGFEGGGHIGRDDIGTMVLVPRVVESVHIPVLASGGIVDGRGLAAALEGRLEGGFGWAGQGVGLICDISSVEELLKAHGRRGRRGPSSTPPAPGGIEGLELELAVSTHLVAVRTCSAIAGGIG